MSTTLINFLKTELKWNIVNLSSIERIGGLSSENYKVSYKNNNYFVKICTHNYLHTDRKNELSIITKAEEINITPHLYYFSTETGNMVSNWIHGAMPSLTDFSSTKFLYRLSSSLKSLHNLKCEKYFNPFDHIRKIVNICKKSNLYLPNSIDMLLNHLTRLEIKLNKNPLIGLCHNDLNVSNILLSNNNLYFVDFEYSSMGDIFFDLATISWFFTEDSRKSLIESYFGEFNDEYYKRLLDYLFVVKFYNATWSLLKSQDSNSSYDYLAGAKMIFKELLNYNSIRKF